ncbi:MAG: transporter [Pseudomonadota bacterium]
MQLRTYFAGMLAAACTFSCHADTITRADSHAPIGVMAEHYHEKGEWMVSYRFMHMMMKGNRAGKDNLSPETIATTIPNRFFGRPMQPPILRVVPTEMPMNMHMFGVMYAPLDQLTLMLMLNVLDKKMDHLTFQGPAGNRVRGGFTTGSSGLGDVSLSGLIRLLETPDYRIHVTLGLSFPTGSTDEADEVLAPTGMRPTLRLPYPMQLGSGTYDPIVGLTWVGHIERYGWGVQWRSVFRTGDNDEGYTLGDEHRLSGWVSYLWSPGVSTSIRLESYHRGNIGGIDPVIVAPVQTADPDNQGIDRLDVSLGLNFAGTDEWAGHRVGFEVSRPLMQDLDGPQLKTDWQLMIGYQYAF